MATDAKLLLTRGNTLVCTSCDRELIVVALTGVLPAGWIILRYEDYSGQHVEILCPACDAELMVKA